MFIIVVAVPDQKFGDIITNGIYTRDVVEDVVPKVSRGMILLDVSVVSVVPVAFEEGVARDDPDNHPLFRVFWGVDIYWASGVSALGEFPRNGVVIRIRRTGNGWNRLVINMLAIATNR